MHMKNVKKFISPKSKFQSMNEWFTPKHTSHSSSISEISLLNGASSSGVCAVPKMDTQLDFLYTTEKLVKCLVEMDWDMKLCLA